MTTDRDATRIVRSWLEEGVTALPDRVLDSVLDQLPTTPQRHAFWLARRIYAMNNTARIAAAAAVVVLAIGGVSLLIRAQPPVAVGPVGSQPSRPTQAPAPQTILNTTALQAGTYTTGRWFPVQFQFTVPAGWETWDTNGAIVRIWKPGPADTHTAILTFEIVRNAYSDACRNVYGPQLGNGVNDLVNALTHVVGLQAGPVIDVSIDGRRGKSFELAEPTACPSTDVYQWVSDGPVGFGGAHQRVTVLDADGTRLVVDAVTYQDSTRVVDQQEMDAIIGSMRFN